MVSAMQRYRMDIAYDGSAYAGWQVQPNGMTVQQRLEEALATLVGTRVKVHGSGRTDQGVHARRQVAHMDLPNGWAPAALMKGMNGLLPADIRVGRVCEAPAGFHARRDAWGKEYRYFIWDGGVLPPHKRFTVWHVRRRLNVAAMRAAAEHLTGRHDFAAFTANPNRIVASTVRRVDAIRILKAGHAITLVVRGEGFLYKMVRSLTGFLVKVGEGGEPPETALEILQSGIRTARVPTAPPQGLFLWNVFY